MTAGVARRLAAISADVRPRPLASGGTTGRSGRRATLARRVVACRRGGTTGKLGTRASRADRTSPGPAVAPPGKIRHARNAPALSVGHAGSCPRPTHRSRMAVRRRASPAGRRSVGGRSARAGARRWLTAPRSSIATAPPAPAATILRPGNPGVGSERCSCPVRRRWGRATADGRTARPPTLRRPTRSPPQLRAHRKLRRARALRARRGARSARRGARSSGFPSAPAARRSAAGSRPAIA